ncbi:MAG TPA: hypothetical protein VNK67_02925 [Burkholderiales bacterium]|nr:hypothetical protein [Burkholderiales bacterium]
MKKVESIQPEQAGLSLSEFLRRVGFSRSTYYSLPKAEKPKLVRIGKEGSKRSAIVVIERPDLYLQRIAEMQAQREVA